MSADREHPLIAAISYLRVNLAPEHRLTLAIEAARACEDEDKPEIIAAIAPTIPDSVPLTHTTAQEAERFFSLADDITVKIYAAAAWKRMDGPSRAGFVAWMQKQATQEETTT